MPERIHQNLGSIFLVSAGTLTFEIVLTRVFALAFWHHFADLAIALALTGFGAAGSLAALLLPRLKERRALSLAITALAAAAAMLLSYPAVIGVGLEPLSLAWSASAWPDLVLVFVILTVPFLLAAAHVALILAWARSPGLTYAANLAGSGAGCLIAAVALSRLLPHQAIYPAAGLVLLGFVSQLKGLKPRERTMLFLATAALAVLVILSPPKLHYEPFKDREVALAAQGNRLEHQVVGLRGVVEVVAGPAFHYAPGLSLSCPFPLPPQAGLFLDGDLVGSITALEADQAAPGFTASLLASLPHQVLSPRRTLVLNPGGGLKLLAALNNGPDEVVGVEENPQVAELMQGPLAGFSGEIYLRPQTRIIRADPAVYLAGQPEKFDLIVLGQGAQWESGSPSGLGVTRLLTVNGLASMLEALTPDGVLAVAGPLMKPPRASIKLMATAAQALRRLGHDPKAGLALVRDWSTALVLVKPSGFTPAECGRIRQATEARGFDLSYLPGLAEADLNRFHLLPGEPLNQAAEAIVSNQEKALFDHAPFNLWPATRDKPYFFRFFRPKTLELVAGSGTGRRLAVTEWGLLFTWGGLAVALLVAGAGIFLPLRALKPRPQGLAFFALIGLGYMLAEITVLHEAIYRIGRPALAVPLVVGVFLVISGLGSLLWGGRRPGWFCLVSAVLLPLSLLALRYLPGGAPVAALALAPAALVMGAPFAGGLVHLSGPRVEARSWAFGVNGFSSVAGSLTATLICLQAGHMNAILAAGACYLLAGLAFFRGIR